jgi:MerR family transcriptional regulator, heat shock protein HspR
MHTQAKQVQNLNTPLFSIGTAARMLGISVHTMRMYEREGLIIPFKADTNQRRYSHTDIERVQCIRSAINDQKISIEGIKRILSLIPCWKVVSCSAADRQSCAAYLGHLQPCWAYNHKNNTCATRDCTTCAVYNEYADCNNIKEIIKKVSQVSKTTEEKST